MKRENRYLVLKHTDISKYLSQELTAVLEDIADVIDDGRKADGKPSLKAAVVEHDWPEYETVWKMIEQRVDGA